MSWGPRAGPTPNIPITTGYSGSDAAMDCISFLSAASAAEAARSWDTTCSTRSLAVEEQNKRRYFRELTFNLQYEGFTVKPETEEGDYRLLAELNNVILAGHPTASSQSPLNFVSRYAENCGHSLAPSFPTEPVSRGSGGGPAQFNTWGRVWEGTANYTAARQDFAVRSGHPSRRREPGTVRTLPRRDNLARLSVLRRCTCSLQMNERMKDLIMAKWSAATEKAKSAFIPGTS